MQVTIDPNIKKKRIFINKNGEQCTEEQMFGQPVGDDLGADPRANTGEQAKK